MQYNPTLPGNEKHTTLPTRPPRAVRVSSAALDLPIFFAKTHALSEVDFVILSLPKEYKPVLSLGYHHKKNPCPPYRTRTPKKTPPLA